MNRRGFLSALGGAGCVAAVPLAPTVAPSSPPVVDPPPAVLVVPPARPLFAVLTDYAFEEFRRFVGSVETQYPHPIPASRMGYTHVIRPSIGTPIETITISRQVCRGIDLGWQGQPNAKLFADAQLAVSEMAGEIVGQRLHGCRGIAFAHLEPPPSIDRADIVLRAAGPYAFRAIRAYDPLRDQLFVRFDVKYGWIEDPGCGIGGGSHLLIVRA